MKKIIITLIVLATLACNFSTLPLVSETRYIQVVYAYKVKSDGGVEFAFLAHRVLTVYDYTQSELPTVEYVKGYDILHPVKDMRFYIKDEADEMFEKGRTDFSGHLTLKSDYSLTQVSHDDSKFSCVKRSTWQTFDSFGNNSGGGAVWQCSDVVTQPASP